MTPDKKKFRPVLLVAVTALPLFGWIYTGFVSGGGDCQVPSRELHPCCKDEDKVGTSCFQIQAAARLHGGGSPGRLRSGGVPDRDGRFGRRPHEGRLLRLFENDPVRSRHHQRRVQGFRDLDRLHSRHQGYSKRRDPVPVRKQAPRALAGGRVILFDQEPPRRKNREIIIFQ